MGDLIYLAERAADRSRPTPDSTAFYFSLDSPLSYLVAERVERMLGRVDWIPVIGDRGASSSSSASAGAPAGARAGSLAGARDEWDRQFAAAKSLAAELNLPLLVPDRVPMESRRASRVAVFAGQAGGPDCVRRFALAMFRLAFCGGFDINSRCVITDAGAAAGLEPKAVLAATRDAAYDLRIDSTAAGLRRRGAPSVPAIRVGTVWFGGVDPLIAVSA